MIVLAALMLSAAEAPERIDWNHPENNAVRLVNNGFCVGLAWVTLRSGEIVTVDYGPDFNVYRVRGPGNTEWGSYSGFAGQSKPDEQHPLLKKDGVAVYRGTADDGSFNGYFIGDDHQQNHFFGTTFKDSATDSGFFDRVILGSTAKSKCERQ